jgi:hypothetical protein
MLVTHPGRRFAYLGLRSVASLGRWKSTLKAWQDEAQGVNPGNSEKKNRVLKGRWEIAAGRASLLRN